jgi:hypothetical protein
MPAVETPSSTTSEGESQGQQQPRRRLSADGSWWWNGRRWVQAITEDGLWKWDGARWNQTVQLEGKRPEDLAATLALLGEDRYAQAGALLAEAIEEWGPDGQVRELAGQAGELQERLTRLKDSLSIPDDGRGGVFGRRAGGADRRQAQEEHDALNQEYRSLTVRLGRIAPQPSIKEADDVLVAARTLDERAGWLTAGLAEVDEAEQMRADAAVAAQRELAAAQEARVRALQEARRAVEASESDHAWAVSEARVTLRTVLTPGPGELKAGLGPLRLFSNLLETPTGRLPAAGTSAFADTAGKLWRDHRQVLADLVLLEAPEASTFRDALTDGSDALFLLVIGRTGNALWPCPPGQEKAARRFAVLVEEHAREAAQQQEERYTEARKAEDDLDSISKDRSVIEGAEAELARVEADPALLGAIDDARQRLERARADTPELVEARRKVLEIARKLVAPPDGLKAAVR